MRMPVRTTFSREEGIREREQIEGGGNVSVIPKRVKLSFRGPLAH